MLKESKVKKKIRDHELVVRSFLRLPDPAIAEVMAMAGVELLVVDQEHFPFDMAKIESIVRACEIHGCECVVRVSNEEPSRIAQVMETGAQGIVVPHVETRGQAQRIVDAVKYGPVGTRGYCPITRTTGYGMRMSPAEFAPFSNDQTLVFVMTETKTGLENLDEILQIPGIDAISIGPSDVSAAYGLPGQIDHPVVKAAIEEGWRKILASGKGLCTQAYTPEAAQRMYAMGSRILTISSDVQLLTRSFKETVERFRAIAREVLPEGEEVLICSMMRLPDPPVAEIMAAAGVDLICIDNEHYPFNMDTIQRITVAVHAQGKKITVRVPNEEPSRISMVMDLGVDGIKIPHVESAEQTRAIVNAVKFAPMGTRGFCPIVRDAEYGMTAAPSEITEEANRRTIVSLMVETKEGLEHMDEILAVPGIDTISIGPSDVSASFGLPGQIDHPVVKAAIDEGSRKVIAAGKQLFQQAYNEEMARKALAVGGRIFLTKSDLQMLTAGFREAVDNTRKAENAG